MKIFFGSFINSVIVLKLCPSRYGRTFSGAVTLHIKMEKKKKKEYESKWILFFSKWRFNQITYWKYEKVTYNAIGWMLHKLVIEYLRWISFKSWEICHMGDGVQTRIIHTHTYTYTYFYTCSHTNNIHTNTLPMVVGNGNWDDVHKVYMGRRKVTHQW